jgi:hypothetical protein
MGHTASAHERITCAAAHELGRRLQPLRLHGDRRDIVLHVSKHREVYVFVAARGAALRDEVPAGDELYASDRSFLNDRPNVYRDSLGNPSLHLRFARIPLSQVEADRIAIWLDGIFGVVA